MSMGRCCSMRIIINIEIDAISCKCTCILHSVFHTVHDDSGSHWYGRIRCIYCNGMIGSWHDSTGSWTTRPSATADGAVAISTGYNLSQRFSDSNRSGLCDCLCFSFHIHAILCFKQFLNHIFYIRIFELTIFHGKKRNQMIRIMGDLINVVAILVIVRISGFDVVDLPVQCILQCFVSIFGRVDIIICTWISCHANQWASSLNRRWTAGKRSGDEHK